MSSVPDRGMLDFCLSVGRGKGWSGAGCWLAGGIMLRGSTASLSPSPCTGHSPLCASTVIRAPILLTHSLLG